MKLSSEMKAALVGTICFLLSPSIPNWALVLLDTLFLFPLNQPSQHYLNPSKVVHTPPKKGIHNGYQRPQSGSYFTGQSSTPLFP